MAEITKTELNRSSLQDLRGYANQLGLTVDPNDTRDVVLSKVRTTLGFPDESSSKSKAKSKTEDTSSDPNDEQEPAQYEFRKPAELAPAPEGTDYNPRLRKVTIRIPSQENDKQPVPVSVNGRTWVIQRDKDAEVPHYVYLTLRDSVEGQLDPTSGTVFEVPMYPVHLVG